jgi:hypothetical protein
MTHGLRRRLGRVVTAAVACGLLASGCSTQDVQPVHGGPPVSPVVAARPIDVEWANALCKNLNPLFAALAPPPSSTAAGYRDQLAKAREALRGADVDMNDVGPPPSAAAQQILAAIDEKLDKVGQQLATAAGGLEAAGPSGATDQARAALTSFDRDELKPLLSSDPSLTNALFYAPACARPAATP